MLPLAKQQVDQNVFIDSAFNLREDKSLQSIDTSRKVVLERLAVLVVDRKNFFPTDNKITIVADQSKVPPVLNELPLLPIEDYKSLFITQSFAPNGKYELIINQFGRFEHVMVDDLIPVYEDTK